MPNNAYNDNVLVKELKQKPAAGGIIISNSSKEFISGEVISSPTEDIKAGSIIMYEKDSARDIDVDGRSLKIVKLRDVVLT